MDSEWTGTAHHWLCSAVLSVHGHGRPLFAQGRGGLNKLGIAIPSHEGEILIRIILDNRATGTILQQMLSETETQSYTETIAKMGFRFTKQRQEVYQALLEKRDHPTAIEVYTRVKAKMPSISLATVYNCLETLTECGLAKHVNIDRAPSRYCPNLEEHGHFYCEQCGAVIDVPFKSKQHLAETWEIPKDSIVTHHEVAFRGLCPNCASQNAKSDQSDQSDQSEPPITKPSQNQPTQP